MDGVKQAGWRNDAIAKVTGRAKYTDDIKVHGMLHGVPVYTDCVHGRINAIETSAAAASPGVVQVVTAKDAPGAVCFGQIEHDLAMFAHDKIRYHGDVVALVVAETRAEALAAQKLVRVEVTELPAVCDPILAMKSDAPLVHDERRTNVVCHHKIRRGDVDAGFAKADIVIEKEFTTSHVEHAYLEPEAALCIPRDDGVMEVAGSMQHPFTTRRFVAALLGKPLAAVEVRGVAMGGGFGGKDDTAAVVCARTALAAQLTGRPVKVSYDREWSLRESYKRHPYRVRYKMGLQKDGTVCAAQIETVADAGAYCSTTPWVTWRSTVQCCGPYRIPNVHCDTLGVYTNNVFTGAMRGFGSPQMNFCVEQMLEMAAEKLGVSGVELRRKNMVQQGDTTITGQRLDDHEVSMGEVLTAALDASDYERKLGRCTFGRGEGDELYGIGVAMSYRGMSLGAEGVDFNGAIINVQYDGSVLLEVAVHENGQGAESAMILLAAEQLGIAKERLRYRRASTSNIPYGGATVASRGTLMGGGAVVDAANKIKLKMAPVAAQMLSCSSQKVLFKDDRLFASEGGRSVAFAEVARQMFLSQELPYAFGTFKAPHVSWDEEKGEGKAYFTWVYGCQVVELHVNRSTGKVRLINAYAAHDVGKAVNRRALLGQFYGGMTMGAGMAVSEKVAMKDGRISSLNFDKYKILRAKDVPEMNAIVIENPDPNSPAGAKGVGEPTLEVMAPAIANAVYNATGKRYLSLPIEIEVA